MILKKRGAKNKIQKNSGQVTVEYLLLAVFLLFLFQLATKTLKDNDYLKNFQATPNKILVNLIENGNWEPDTDKSRELHPNQYDLHYTPEATP